jgi:hypothetical protein
MKVHIDGTLYLESDGLQFMLREYDASGKRDKKGNELYKQHGYFSQIQHALKFALRMKVMESNAKTLKELQQEIEAIRKHIEGAFNL